MSSFVNRGIKVFAKDEGYLVTRKRSEGRMKRYESAQDLRAWCLNTEEKRRYLIELMLRSSGGEDAYGKYIPVPTLISTITAMKDEQIEELERALAAYRSLKLTDEQRAQLNKQLGQPGDKSLKKQDSTTVLFRRKDKVCRCAPPMEREELLARIGELQDELERRDKEAKRQMSCLEKCIAKEKRRVEKVKQSLANERRVSEGTRGGELGKSTPSCAERAENALRQVQEDQSTICALECKLSEMRAANLELQSLLDAEKQRSCDPKQCEAMQDMQEKMEAAQKSEAAMRDKLASLETFLRRSSNAFGRPLACTGPNCVQQRRSCKDRSTTPPGDFHPTPNRSQSLSPNRSRIPSEDRSRSSLPSDDLSSDTDQSQSRSSHRCRPPFVSTPRRSTNEDFRSMDNPERSSKCVPCSENKQSRSMPPPGDPRSRQEVGQPQVPQVTMVPPMKPLVSNCQPCSEKRAREERVFGEPRSRQEVSPPHVPQVTIAPPLKPLGSNCQPCSEKRLRDESLHGRPTSRQERSRTPGPQIGMILDSSGSLSPCQPCTRRSSSGGPEFNDRRKRIEAQEHLENERAGTGHRDCWKLMVSRPKKAPSSMSTTSGESDDSSDISNSAMDSSERDYVCTYRSPSPLPGCHKNSCPSSPTTCRSLREQSPVPRHYPPVEGPTDSFRIVSETYRAPAVQHPSPSMGNESGCPGSNGSCRGSGVRDTSPAIGDRRGYMDSRVIAPDTACRGSGNTAPLPLLREQKGLMDARLPVPNFTCRGSCTVRAPVPVIEEQITVMDKNKYQPPVMRDRSPMSDDRRMVTDQKRLQSPSRGPFSRDQSPRIKESRATNPSNAKKNQATTFADRRVVLDASKVPSRRGRSPKPTHRSPTPNALNKRKSPVGTGERRVSVDINRGLHNRRQSPITLDGRPVSDPRRTPTTNASCRGQSPMPIILRCTSREPSPGERCGRQAAMERQGCGRDASPRQSCSAPRNVQCELIVHPELRKSVPFSNVPNNGRCGNQAKHR